MGGSRDMDRLSLGVLAELWGFSFTQNRCYNQKIPYQSFCKLIFPDYYSLSTDEVNNSDQERMWSGWYCLNREYRPRKSTQLQDNLTSLRDFIGDNRRKSGGMAYVELSVDLMEKLLSDDVAHYSEPVAAVSHRISMLRNIRTLMNDPDHLVNSKNHPVFTHFGIASPATREKLPKDVQSVIQMLLHSSEIPSFTQDIPPQNFLTYALFLTILSAIYHDKLCDSDTSSWTKVSMNPRKLLSGRLIWDSLIAMDEADEIPSVPSLSCDCVPGAVPFTNPYYMNTYHVYMFQTSKNRLFDSGTLVLSHKSKDEPPTATLCLEQKEFRKEDGKASSTYKNYTGVPLKVGDLIQIPMYETEHDLPFTLYFSYDKSFTRDMYMREAFVVRCDAQRTNIPLIQRALITLYPASEEGLIQIQGALQIPSDVFRVRISSMEDFLAQFALEPWIQDFKKDYLPTCEKTKSYYICTTSGLSNHWSHLKKDEALRLILTVKAYAEEDSVVLCDPPLILHRTLCSPYL